MLACSLYLFTLIILQLLPNARALPVDMRFIIWRKPQPGSGGIATAVAQVSFHSSRSSDLDLQTL